jgi:hypothetical protein
LRCCARSQCVSTRRRLLQPGYRGEELIIFLLANLRILLVG